jgi:hypothetical protein
MTDDEPSVQRVARSRRAFLAAAVTGAGSLTGCLRFSQQNAAEATEAASRTATPTPGDTPSSESTATDAEETAEETPTETTAVEQYPDLSIELVDEKDLGDGSSSVATKVAGLDDSRVVTLGGRQVAVLEADSLSEVLTVEIPDVINTGHHGLTVVDGEIYAAVGGSVPSRVLRIEVDSGRVWRFVEEEFGPNVSRSISGPVVTDEYVCYVAATTENREGDNAAHWYVLDRATGELVEKPPMSAFEQETCYVEGIATDGDTVVLGGCSGYYFYDLDALEYTGSEGGFLGDVLEVRDGTMYTGPEAYDVSEQAEEWSNKSGGANRALSVTDDRVYYIYNDDVIGVGRSDGAVAWEETYESYSPTGLVASSEAVWMGTDTSPAGPGHIFEIDPASGDVAGAAAIQPQYSNRASAEPYGMYERDGTLFVGSAGSLLKYE